MVSSFAGLNIANTGLAAYRLAIETAGHNVANANTEGYSRQRVDLGSIDGGAAGIFSGISNQGGGVDVVATNRIVDQFLINRTNTERSAEGMYSELQKTYARLEASFDEPGDTGLAAQMEEFWSAWDTVALTPDDEAARAALLQRAEALASRFQSLTRSFDLMSDDVLQRADAIVVDVNGTVEQIAHLNAAIVASTEAGNPPNDLLDQRDLLVRRLTEYVDVRTRITDTGAMDISMGGASLVSGPRFNTISLDTTTPGAAVLRVSNSSVPLRPTGGQLQGLLQSANTVIPNQQAALDGMATQLAALVNGTHALGQDLDGNPGGPFFTATSARDFSLSAAVAGNPRAVAAAALGGGVFDGSIAIRMAEHAGLDGGPDDIYRAMIATLGVSAQSANQRLSLQQEVTASLDAQREAVSGVSIDEEMTNLVAFQQAYGASARFMTAVDEMLERLINGTGTVGR